MDDHDWIDIGTGLVTCSRCPVKVTPVVITRGAVPPCDPGERCLASYSLTHHEIVSDLGGGASCIFCGQQWSPARGGPETSRRRDTTTPVDRPCGRPSDDGS